MPEYIFFLSKHVRRPWKLIKQPDTSGAKLIPARCVQTPRECNQPQRLIDTNWHQFPSIYEESQNFTTLGGICRRWRTPGRRYNNSWIDNRLSSVKLKILFRNDLDRWHTSHFLVVARGTKEKSESEVFRETRKDFFSLVCSIIYDI